MKKLIILLFLLVIQIPLWCYGFGLMGSGGGVGGTVVNGEIGQSTHDVSDTANPNVIYHDKFTPTTPGPINYCHVYVANHNTDNVCVSIFNATGTELASGSHLGTTSDAEWVTVTLDVEVILVEETTYYLGYQCDYTTLLYSRDAGDGAFYFSSAYNCGQNITAEDNTWGANDDICIYCDNNAGAPE